MNDAKNLFNKFTKSSDPKTIIVTAFEIKEHFANVLGQEPKDETGEEFLYIIGGKNESFEWLLLLIIIQLNIVGYGEYFTKLSRRENLLNAEQCKWATTILKEIRPQMNDLFKEYCDDLIVIFERVINSKLSKEKEFEKDNISEVSKNESTAPFASTRESCPDLLLLVYDKQPTNKNAFVNSVVKSLDFAIDQDTDIMSKQYDNAQILESVLPFAISSAMSYFKKYSLELDVDKSIYSRFKSASSGKFIQGYYFGMFSKPTNFKQKKLKKIGFWQKLFNKTKISDPIVSAPDPKKGYEKAKGTKIQVILISDYNNFFKSLAKKLDTSDPDIIYSKIGVFCEKCNIQYTQESLELLFISKSFGGAKTVILGATKEGSDLRSGKCPNCGHAKMSILVQD